MKNIFISYSWEHDTKNAIRIYSTLTSSSSDFNVWMDKKNLPAGLAWKPAIIKAIREADFFIALLSPGSVKKRRGMTNYEMREALEVLKEFSPSEVYLIPARVDKCTSPFEELASFNYVDLYPNWREGMQKLMATLGATLISQKKISPVIAGKKNLKPKYHYKIGLVDLDLGLTNLEKVIKQLNQVQDYFLFALPEMPPLKNKVGRIDGMKNFFVSRVSKSFITKHKHSETDFIACLTHYPLAFTEGKRVLYNYFSGPSDHDERFMFLSTDLLKEFSYLAGTEFEEGIVYILIGQLISYFTDTDFHEQTRGCVLDFCENRADVVKGFKNRKLCNKCNKKLPEGELKKAILTLLKWKYQ